VIKLLVDFLKPQAWFLFDFGSRVSRNELLLNSIGHGSKGEQAVSVPLSKSTRLSDNQSFCH
jgi:hypothetical protein